MLCMWCWVKAKRRSNGASALRPLHTGRRAWAIVTAGVPEPVQEEEALFLESL